MAYAFLDLSNQYQLEVVNGFMKLTNCDIGYINTSSGEHFHGNKIRCYELIDNIKSSNGSIVSKCIDDFLYIDDFLKSENDIPWVITSEDISKARHIESMSLRLMDRSSLMNASSFARRRYYLILLNYYTNLIDKKNITDVVVFDIPHSFFSHILYELCRLKGKNTIMLEYHYVAGYSLMVNDYDFPSVPKTYMSSSSFNELDEILPKKLKDKIFKVSPILLSHKGDETKAIIKKSPFSSLKLYARYLDKSLKNLIMGVFPFLFKKEVLHFASLDNIRNRFYYRNILNVKLMKLIKLNIHYNKIAVLNPDLDKDFVFVGLHMQPEKTSQPMGFEFDNQYMMIKVISQSVPSGWKVYVKEHPNQFNVKKIPAVHYRDKVFYDSLASIENVEFIPLELDSIQLVERANMVATLTGTLGWEAISDFKPVLVFGQAYYMHCKCVRIVTSVETCKKAIIELSSMSQEEMKFEIYRYLTYYYENQFLVYGARWESEMDLHELSYNEQIENIIERMKYFHGLNNVKKDD